MHIGQLLSKLTDVFFISCFCRASLSLYPTIPCASRFFRRYTASPATCVLNGQAQNSESLHCVYSIHCVCSVFIGSQDHNDKTHAGILPACCGKARRHCFRLIVMLFQPLWQHHPFGWCFLLFSPYRMGSLGYHSKIFISTSYIPLSLGVRITLTNSALKPISGSPRKNRFQPVSNNAIKLRRAKNVAFSIPSSLK